MTDPTLFEPPEPLTVPPAHRASDLVEPAVAAKRLRAIASGMRAAQQRGVHRAVLGADVADLEDAADLLDRINNRAQEAS